MNEIVLEFFKKIYGDIIKGEKYGLRIEIEDGGYNSYIGLDVDIHTHYSGKIPPATQGIRFYRHTNSRTLLANQWKFQWGGVCENLADFLDTPLEFSSYGKTPQEAEKEAIKYFKRIEKIIEKKTSDFKIEYAKSVEEEKEKLLARLSELNSNEC